MKTRIGILGISTVILLAVVSGYWFYNFKGVGVDAYYSFDNEIPFMYIQDELKIMNAMTQKLQEGHYFEVKMALSMIDADDSFVCEYYKKHGRPYSRTGVSFFRWNMGDGEGMWQALTIPGKSRIELNGLRVSHNDSLLLIQ